PPLFTRFPYTTLFRSAVEKPLPRVMGHGALLVQVLANLISNAVKFVPAGSVPRVTVRAEREGGRVRIWIEDNGIGIEKRHFERIDRKSTRLDSSHLVI